MIEVYFALLFFYYLCQDKTFRSEEISRNHPVYIPFFRKQSPLMKSIPNHILKVLEAEINSLKKVNSFNEACV